jgi:transcriptional regulator with XRE-family HTH domain
VFAQRVRFAREAQEMSTRALARAARIDQANVSMLENGVSGTSLRFASLYAEALDVPLAWLLDPSEEVGPWES